MKYLPIIGFEVHIELKTKSKMFCGCDARHFQVKPNTHTCPVCLGLPGALPVPNKKAIEWCLITGTALNCKIPLESKFDRKNYFYPDLPKGYQISQYDAPFCVNGFLNIKIDNKEIKIGITRVHMEEDTGKLIHRQIDGKKYTLIDFNRSGVSLMEIVSEPDIHSSEQALLYLKKLQQIIRYLEVSDCDMEKGSMRCEANISLTSQNQKSKRNRSLPLSVIASQLNKNQNQKFKIEKLPDYKVEIKNLNSFRFVKKAINYEIERQAKILNSGKTPVQETRGFDQKTGKTFSQRTKEAAHDYRYFPEPDIPPFKWDKKYLEELRNLLPELPDQKLERFQKNYKMSEKQANALTKTRETADYFEKVAKLGLDIQQAANIIINRPELLNLSCEEFAVKIKKEKAELIEDEKELVGLVKKVIQENPRPVSNYKQGKEQAFQYLVGQVMKVTKGRASPQIVKKLLIKELKNLRTKELKN